MASYLVRQRVLVSSLIIGSALLWSVLGGTSLSVDGAAPYDPGREGGDPSSESETVSWSPFVHPVAMQAGLPLMMPPTVAAPHVDTLEDDGLGVFKRSFLFYLLFACFALCHVSYVCYVSTLYQPVSWLY